MNAHVESRSLLPVSEDDRRTIMECNFPSMSVQAVYVNEGRAILGQHYHAKKSELFCVIEGGGILHTVRVDERGTAVGIVVERSIIKGDIINVPAFHAHRFDMRENSRMIVFSSEPFDADDLHRHEIDI